VFETSTGITVTARAGEEPAKSFSGRTEDLDQLVRKSAEAIYEQMQPFRFANYLYFEGRYNESIPIVKRLSHDPNPVERAWALQALGTIALANEDGDLAQFAADERAALEALPGLLRARESLAWAELRLGHDAEAVEMATQCVTASPASEATVAPAWHSFFAAECLAVKSSLEGDYPAVLDAAASLSEQDRVRVNFLPDPLITGPLSTHDLDVVPNDSWYATLATVAAGPMAMLIENARNFDLARNALERGEPGAVELLNKVCAFDNTLGKKRSHDYMLRVHGLWLALAKAKFGDLAGGQAMIAETPMDCRMCVDFRGRIAALAGNTADAEQWFAEAIEMAPKLPQVYIDRGQARLDRAELDGALADASEAATLSPHDGDAWKLWGDVLAKQGHAMEALAKYDEALKYAPQWKQLQEAREAAGKQGT
jgi:tetratricopeptide (TPR) repeat protein